MDNQHLILEQYRIYTEQKEQFISRNFTTNRFYIILNIALLLLVFLTQDLKMYNLSASCLFCIAGFVSCSLWWINIDSYNCLIKIKFSTVIEALEKQLPVQPYAMEYKAIKDYRTHKKGFFFSDIQKVFAVILILTFFICLLIEIIPNFVKSGI